MDLLTEVPNSGFRASLTVDGKMIRRSRIAFNLEYEAHLFSRRYTDSYP